MFTAIYIGDHITAKQKRTARNMHSVKLKPLKVKHDLVYELEKMIPKVDKKKIVFVPYGFKEKEQLTDRGLTPIILF